MKRFIRTKDNQIFDLKKIKKQLKDDSSYYSDYKDWKLIVAKDNMYGELSLNWKAYIKDETRWGTFGITLHCNSSEYIESDNLEDLIQDNDMLYLYDLYPDVVLVVEGNIKPFGYNEKIKLKEWLKYNNDFDLYVRENDDYKLEACKRNGEIKLA